MSISEQDWQAAVDAIGEAEVAVISCHVHPDGDALGSALALHRALANAGREAVVSFSEPFVVARHYRFLAGLDRLVPPDQVPHDADLFVCFDAGSLDRLGTLVDAFRGAARTLVVAEDGEEDAGVVQVAGDTHVGDGHQRARLVGPLGLQPFAGEPPDRLGQAAGSGVAGVGHGVSQSSGPYRVTSLPSSSTPGVRSASRSAATSTRRAWKPSPATVATARVARCRRS